MTQASTAPRVLPVLLEPSSVRVVSVAHGVDRNAYAAAVLGAVFHAMPAAELARAIALPALSVADPEHVTESLDAATAASLRQEAEGLDRAARACLAVPGEVISACGATVVTTDQDGVPAGTVVWACESDRSSLQFVLLRLHVHLETGALTRKLSAARKAPGDAPAAMTRMGISGSESTWGGVVELATSVSWALPPPWGALATGALTLIHMLMGTDQTDDQPLEKVKADLESFIQSQDIESIGSDLRDHADNLAKAIVPLKGMTIDSLEAAGPGYLTQVEDFFSGTYGLGFVHLKVTHLLDLFDKAPLKDCKATLELVCAGITLWINASKIRLQLEALDSAQSFRQGDMTKFVDQTHTWMSDFETIRSEIVGLTDEEAGPGMAGNGPADSWTGRVTARIDALRTARLGQIGAVSKYDTTWKPSEGPISLASHGYQFVDEGADDAPKTYDRDDDWVTQGTGCSAKWVEVDGEAQVDQLRTGVVASVTADLDAQFSTANDCVAAWAAALKSFQDQMPPAAPTTAPVAESKAGGPKTPHGTGWIRGHSVSYAAQYVDAKGPSDAGPWSEPLVIGKVGYATVSSLPVDPSGLATNLRILRRFQADGGAPTRTLVVGNVDAASSTFDDVHKPDA